MTASLAGVPIATPQSVPTSRRLTPPLNSLKASNALLLAILSLVSFGFTAPYALIQAHSAERMIRANPGMCGASEAKTARIIATVVLCCQYAGIAYYLIAHWT